MERPAGTGAAVSSWSRVRAVLRARMELQERSGGWPIAPMLMHAAVAALVAGLTRGELPDFAFGVVALTLTAALVAIPLLGEFGHLLRADDAQEWVEALPAGALELRAARTIHLVLLLTMLGAASLAPSAVLLASGGAGAWAGCVLIACGIAELLALAALLLAVQSLFRGRAEGLLVLFQTALVVVVVAGLLVGLRAVPLLADLERLDDAPWAALFPPAWFAAPLGGTYAALPVALGALAAAALAATPAPPQAARGAGRTALDVLLLPARGLATVLWVHRDERGAFDLVYDGAPREREFVLRTYPMVGIPLAFLAVATAGGDPTRRAGFLALLLFTSGIYLPILLTQLAGSASHRARWILDTAPVSPAAVAGGALKALATRFLVPLYLALFVLAWRQAGLAVAFAWALPAALIALAVLRGLYPTCVVSPPLSLPPDEIDARLDWSGPLLVLAIGLTVVAALAWRFLHSVPAGLAVTAALVGLEVVSDRAWRRRGTGAGPPPAGS